MNADALTLAYRELLRVARRCDAALPASHATRAEANWKLVHIALSDALIEEALKATEAGATAVLNNRSAQDASVIQATIDASTAAERLEQLRSRSQSVIARLTRWGPALWGRPVRLLVHNRDLNLVADRETTWKDLIALRSSTHLPAHTRQFQAWMDASRSAQSG